MLSGFMEWLSNTIQSVLGSIISLLPTSPFREFINNFDTPEYLGWLNWFFPVQQVITIMGVWLISIALFYLYSIIMRWVKVIGD